MHICSRVWVVGQFAVFVIFFDYFCLFSLCFYYVCHGNLSQYHTSTRYRVSPWVAVWFTGISRYTFQLFRLRFYYIIPLFVKLGICLTIFIIN